MNQAELFLSSIKSKETRDHYSHFLQKYMEFAGLDPEVPDLELGNGNSKEIESKIIEFIMQLKKESKFE
jgi:hypothetical protein